MHLNGNCLSRQEISLVTYEMLRFYIYIYTYIYIYIYIHIHAVFKREATFFVVKETF